MDPEKVMPLFDTELVAHMSEYLAAVDAGDLQKLEMLYAPDFVNIRYDKRGFAVNIPRDIFMAMLHMWDKQGGHPEPKAEFSRITATTRFGNFGTVLLVRKKGGKTGAYNFIWQKTDAGWHVLRELTFEEALPVPEGTELPPIPES